MANRRIDAAKILGRQMITMAPFAVSLLLAYVSWRVGSDGWGNPGVKIAVVAAVAAVVMGFVNSSAFGQLRDENPGFFLGQTKADPTPTAARLWTVTRAGLLGIMVVSMIGFIVAIVA